MNWNAEKRIDSAAAGILAIAVSAFMAMSLASVAITENSAKRQSLVRVEASAKHAPRVAAVPAAGGSPRIASR